MNALNEPVIRAELAKIGLRWANCISWNAGVAELYQQALERGEEPRRVLERMSEALVSKLMHAPTQALNAAQDAEREELVGGAVGVAREEHHPRGPRHTRSVLHRPAVVDR